jgi:predicted transglutaminase-like cysteine proteinase
MDNRHLTFKEIFLAIAIMAAVYIGIGASCAALAEPLNDRQALRMLNSINRAANVEIPQGTPWNDGRDGIWNCEEVAGLKLGRLIDAGYPHKVRSYQVVTSWGEPHAVLEVTLPSGRSVVLDSLDPWVLTREQTAHTNWRPAYIQRQ